MARAHLRHALALGHCRSGVRKYMAHHSVEPAEIIGPNAPGIDTKRLRTFGDKFSCEIADLAEDEASRG